MRQWKVSLARREMIGNEPRCDENRWTVKMRIRHKREKEILWRSDEIFASAEAREKTRSNDVAKRDGHRRWTATTFALPRLESQREWTRVRRKAALNWILIHGTKERGGQTFTSAAPPPPPPLLLLLVVVAQSPPPPSPALRETCQPNLLSGSVGERDRAGAAVDLSERGPASTQRSFLPSLLPESTWSHSSTLAQSIRSSHRVRDGVARKKWFELRSVVLEAAAAAEQSTREEEE